MTSFLVCFKVKDGKLGWESRGNQEIYNQESNICIHFYHKGWVTSDLSRLQSDSESESCSVVSDSLWPHGPYSPWNFPGQNTGVVIIPVSSGSSQPRNRSGVSCIAGGFFTSWATREAFKSDGNSLKNCHSIHYWVTQRYPAIRSYHSFDTHKQTEQNILKAYLMYC